MNSSDDEDAPHTYGDPTAPPPEPSWNPPGATAPLPVEGTLALPGSPAASPSDGAPTGDPAAGPAATAADPPPPARTPEPAGGYPPAWPYPEPVGHPQQMPSTQPGGYPAPGAGGQPGEQPSPHPPIGPVAPVPPYVSPGYPAPPYASPGYPPPAAPGYSPPPYASPGGGGTNGSALALTIVSGIGTLCCLFSIPSLVVGIVALTKQQHDPEGASRLARIGWIVFGVLASLAVIVVIGFFALGLSGPLDSNTEPYDGY